LFLILRIAWNIAFRKVVEDLRSDDETEAEEEVGVQKGHESIDAKIEGVEASTGADLGEEVERVLRSRQNGKAASPNGTPNGGAKERKKAR
jgi:hypothetical protein